MSFWRTFSWHQVSPIETILERENFTLEDLLDEDEILTELKSQNKNLISFFARPETLLQLVKYITKIPDDTSTEEETDPEAKKEEKIQISLFEL